MARRLHAASGGLPDFVNEVVASLVKQGILKVKGEDANRLDWAQQELAIPVSAAATRSIDRDLVRVSAAGLRLLVAIPALDEEKTVGSVIRAIPGQLAGVSRVDVLVVDDGSADRTGAEAMAAGARVIRHDETRGVVLRIESPGGEPIHFCVPL